MSASSSLPGSGEQQVGSSGESDRIPRALELSGIVKVFGKVRAVDGVSMAVETREFLSLLGPSGCGKTTTLRIVAGFETPDAGRVFVAGQDVTTVAPNRRSVNTVFQHYALFPHYTVWENVAYGLRAHHVARADQDARVSDALARVELVGLERRRPSQLSGGQQQRVALARALVLEPSVLLLDEPLGALDLKLRKQMQVELKRLQREVGISFVYVTHDQEEAFAMSDRVALMRAGRIVQLGTPQELYEQPASRYVADFVGESNLLAGVVVSQSESEAVIDIGIAEISASSQQRVVPGAPVTVMIRPEHVILEPISNRGGQFVGRIAQVVLGGPIVRFEIRLSTGELVMARRERVAAAELSTLREGDECSLTWSPQDAKVLTE